MCQMLLSIHPKHVENIFLGTKRFEFRKVRCRSPITKIIIYSTSPIMQVVAEAEVVDIIEDNPSIVWEKTQEFAGISKTFFDDYFNGRDKAIAYQFGKITRYDIPKNLSDYGILNAPQSFVYL